MMEDFVSKSDFRNAMARVCMPVNIITTNGQAGRGGFTATAMCSVTDEPPSLLVCLNKSSKQCDVFLRNMRFCVNVLSGDHKDLANGFAGGIPDMEARYAAAEWEDLPSGNQALRDAIVAFDCALVDTRVVGTHHILLGNIVGVRSRLEGNALLYFDRNYVNVSSPAAQGVG